MLLRFLHFISVPYNFIDSTYKCASFSKYHRIEDDIFKKSELLSLSLKFFNSLRKV